MSTLILPPDDDLALPPEEEAEPLIHTRLSFELERGWQLHVLTFPEEHTQRLCFERVGGTVCSRLKVNATASYSRGKLSGLSLHFFLQQKLVEPQERLGYARTLLYEHFNLMFDYAWTGEAWEATPNAGRFTPHSEAISPLSSTFPIDLFRRVEIAFPDGFLPPLTIRQDIQIYPPRLP